MGFSLSTLGIGKPMNRIRLMTWAGTLACAAIAPSGTFKAVAMGGGFGCAVKTNGSVVCWGTNDVGQAPATVSGTSSGEQ